MLLETPAPQLTNCFLLLVFCHLGTSARHCSGLIDFGQLFNLFSFLALVKCQFNDCCVWNFALQSLHWNYLWKSTMCHFFPNFLILPRFEICHYTFFRCTCTLSANAFFYVCFNIPSGVYAGMHTERIQPFFIFFILQKKKWWTYKIEVDVQKLTTSEERV